ncbi:HNH endonuclease [Knoellia locipacati]|uniref:HNH endonuclease signature motif containing protein n=1 Tax=Knoellia locipacati TaxID=882824 RepID=UPI00384CAC85
MNLTAVRTAMADLYAAIAAPAEDGPESAGSLAADSLLETVEQAQRVINIAGGIQTHALAHLAAHDEVRNDEDETGWSWKRHGLGFTAEDTASLVGPRLGVSVPVAQGRVEVAVHQVCVTPRLVDAVGSGDLDLFRAQIITREVMPCSDEVAREIVDRLLGHAAGPDRWSETAGPLGSRTRRLVARLAPEVAAAAKERAIKDRALTRRTVSAAADLWNGLVPVEQSLVMWQAVDHLARELQRTDPDLTLDQARLDAMQQLILGQADVTIHLHATHAEAESDDFDDVKSRHHGHVDAEPSDDEAQASAQARHGGQAATKACENEPHERMTAEGSDSHHGLGASSVDLAERALRGVVELAGLGRPGTTVVDLDGLPSCVRLAASTPLGCHRSTGALPSGVVPHALAPCDLNASPPDAIESKYRPSPGLQRLIRLRDGHCRFPGCQIAARSCDIDHVIAWPAGLTSATNLMCLCRRHHRVKQRPGWTARLDPDGVVHWTDPGGRAADTRPVDHLDRIHQLQPSNRASGDSLTRRAASEDGAPRQVGATTTPAGTSDDSLASLVAAGATEQGLARTAASAKSPAAPRRPMTRATLRDLLHSYPASPDTLVELSLARLLELTPAIESRTKPLAPDWGWAPDDRLLTSTVRTQPPPRPPSDEAPPF